ncbi:MAG: tRNA (adenosine(37)-N6)-dimethylallyltransferase MiaA [Beijerinckiaceae bacterium]
MGEKPLDICLAALDGRDALLIAGPTASGKSALAIAVAQAVSGVVVNADSMQLYAGPRILTARPSPEEEASVAHRLFGVVDPREEANVGTYLRLVAPTLAELKASDRPAIITGGTGLYFRALTEGLVETPPIPVEIATEVERMATEGVDLHGWLASRDPASAKRIAPADTPRLMRAAMVWLATGRSIGDWRGTARTPLLAPDNWSGVFLSPDRETLYARINRRFEGMMAEGALDEAREIAALSLSPNRGVMKAHGMPHLLAHLSGALPIGEAIAYGQRDTRNYAKRQETWARKFMADWRWIGATQR